MATFYVGQTDYITQLNTLSSSLVLPSISGNSNKYLFTDGTTTSWQSLSSTYSLPTASSSVLGGVKVDGTTITINAGTGIISGFNGSYTSLTSKPSLATVATSGSYTDLINTPASYSLPIATTSVLGGVKVDGTTITISNGVISGVSSTYSLPTATTTVLGGVKVDGTTITISNGVISGSSTYSLPTASTTILGGIKVDGTTITINNGVISGSSTYSLPTASTTVLGGIKVDGTTITITSGVISGFNGSYSSLTNTPTLFSGSYTDLTSKPSFATVATSGSYTDLINLPSSYSLPTASSTVLGGIKVDGVTLAYNGSGQLYYTGSGVGGYTLPVATTSTLGGVKVDGTTITITSGVISGFNGSYSSLTNTPTLFSGSYTDLTSKPSFATVATSGSYTDLTSKPSFATVATSGSYTDLINLPSSYSLPTASSTVLGGIKVDGVTLAYNGSGQLYYTGSGVGGYTLPVATTSTLGGIIVGTGLSVSTGTVSVTLPIPSVATNSGKYLTTDGSTVSWAAISGGVSSVGLSLPNIFSISNSPIVSSGTIVATLANQNANKVLAGPTTGLDAAPEFRALVAADIPSTLDSSTSIGGSNTSINLGTSGTAVSIGASTGTTTVNNALVVTGNFTVNGTTQTINSTTLTVVDKNIELAKVTTPTNITADGGGITIKGTSDKTFNYVNANTAWTSSENLDLASGKVYKVGTSTVLDKSTLTLNGSTSGTVTISSPAVAGTQNYTMPLAYPGTTGYALTSDTSGTLNWGNFVTSVAALTLGTTGTDITSTIATGTTTPVITLNIPTASASNRGALSSADWTSFNSKASTTNPTFSGIVTFSTYSNIKSLLESVTINASAPASAIDFDFISGSTVYYTSNATTNFTINVRGNSGTTTNTFMSVGQSATMVLIVTNGATAYYPTDYKVDNNNLSSVTVKYANGTSITSGNTNSLDIYSITVIKTANNVFTVLVTRTKF